MLDIEARCNVDLNRWYADDGILIGRIEEVQRALDILRDVGPGINFTFNVANSTAH